MGTGVSAMTRELQRAMARCEEARIQYRKVVLASLSRASNGDAIRNAIQEFQSARAELNLARARAAQPPKPVTASSRRAPSGIGFVQRIFGVG